MVEDVRQGGGGDLKGGLVVAWTFDFVGCCVASRVSWRTILYISRAERQSGEESQRDWLTRPPVVQGWWLRTATAPLPLGNPIELEEQRGAAVVW